MEHGHRGLLGIHRRSLAGAVIDLCCLAALLVAAMFTLMLISLEHLQSDQNRLSRSSELLTQTARVQGSVLDLETGVRGYLLSDRRVFLQPYERARRELPGELASLVSLANGPRETARVDGIRRSVKRYVAAYAAPLVVKGPDMTGREQVAMALRGKTRVDAIRRQFTSLENIDQKLRRQDRTTAGRESTRAIVFGAIGLALSILLLMGLAAYLVRRLLDPMRTVSRGARDLAAGWLTTRVPEVGQGEVAELARSFNAMAGTLETRNLELSRAHERLEQAVEEANSASQMKTNFLANMSHEIRTPLNGLVGSMALLSDTPLQSEQVELVELARSSGDALLAVVNDVLDIAKIESGRMELEERDFDLPHAVEDACDLVAAAAAQKGLELQALIQPDVPALVRGDQARVAQILTNLLSNAVKFTSRGEITVEVSLAARAGSQVKLQIEVRDTGIGIEQADLARLFEPFTQADAGTTRTYGGTGLGLTIARQLTSMMHGNLSVESQVGRGSSFQVTLPFSVADNGAEPLSVPRELAGLHVLVVHGNATSRRILGGYLSAWGMRADLADSLPSGLANLGFAAAQGDPFHVLVVDEQLAARREKVRADELASSRLAAPIPVVLLSASVRSAGSGLAAGDAVPVHKPVRRAKLLDAIGQASGRVGIPEEPEEAGSSAPKGDAGMGREQAPGRGRRILVAEDHAINWMLVERLLARRGHLAVNALNGEHLLERLREGEFDLVLMDCQMPILDGYEATRRLRRREESTGRHIPVVAMTANALRGDRERCLAAGMDDYLSKPITGEALDAVLTRWLPAEEAAPAPDPALGSTPGAPGVDPISPAPGIDPVGQLDPESLRQLRSLFPGPETAAMLAELQKEVDGQLRRLDDALGDGLNDEVAEAAHRIKGSAHMVGAGSLVQAAARAQMAAQSDGPEVPETVRALHEAWESVRLALELECASLEAEDENVASTA